MAVEADEVVDGHETGPSSHSRDATIAAHAHQFKKVLDLSDVIIQVCGNTPITNRLINATIGVGCQRSHGL